MIQLSHVTKEFKGNTVLSDISMEIGDGQLTVLIGPSGCGKTTTLKMINRLIPATSGDISINGKNIRDIDPVELRRNMGYVIQQGGLFPHMTVRQNIEIIEQMEKKDPQQIVENTARLMKMVDLDPEEYLDRYPSELSGGQRQRIGVIRALANDPDIVLLDEPFSALDPVTRSSLQEELIELQEKVGKTMVFVTHDMDEAIRIADRICIMRGGHILQFDTPEMILRKPADDFVANFVGTGRIWDSPEYIKVEDFMIKSPVTCRGTMNRNRCILRMKNFHVDTLLVTDEEDRLQGIIGRKDLFHAGPLSEAAAMMHEAAYVVHTGDSIVDVLKIVEESDVSNIPVVDDEGRLAGLLTSSSLVSTLSRQFLTEAPAEEGGVLA
ncbi:MAG: ABC transporter ATP-binding protein [Emergencia sp.]